MNILIIQMFKDRYYYYLVNNFSKKNLGFPLSEQIKKQKFTLDQPSLLNMSQLWMIKLATQENTYKIYHCLTGLVLEVATKTNAVQLHHSKNKDTQLFQITKKDGALENVYLISQFNKNVNLLTFDKFFTADSRDVEDQQAQWIIQQINDHSFLNESYIICFRLSGLVLDVHECGLKEGALIVQNESNGLFHQRWVIQKKKNFFTIKNLKSNLYIEIKNKKLKEGGQIVQSSESTTHLNQLWSIQQRGYHLYSIRSAFSPDLFLGISNRSIKEGCEATLTKDEFKHLWKIIGNFL